MRKSPMRNLVMLTVLLMFSDCQAAEQDRGGATRPNIIFMLSDDQGWGGLSVPMHPDHPLPKENFFQTPSLEVMAARGMRFSAAYAPAPVCSPTRASLITGMSPARLHWTKAAPPVENQKLTEPRLVKNLSPRFTTFAELLQQAGYATAHYGKWHIGGGGPGQHGYDEHDGDTGNEQAFQFTDPNPVDIFGMAVRADKFMENQSKAGKPFFIQLSWNALHASENALHATREKYQRLMRGENEKRINTAAITEDLDTGVGIVFKAIERLGLTENTYVIYMSDNGAGGGKNSLLRGGKGGLWEGGIRVPFLVVGPGIKPNSWCQVPIIGYDLFPTFCEWGRIPTENVPKELEGGSLVSLLTQGGVGEVQRSREELFFHFPHYQNDETPQSAILKGDWKLIKFYEEDQVRLFDLSQDLGERHNLAATNPAQVDQMRRQLEKYLIEIGAQIPTANPAANPNQPVTPPRNQKGKPNRQNQPGKRRPDDKPPQPF